MSERIQCPECGGNGSVWYCQNCGATQAPGTSWVSSQGAQAPGQNPPCNSCGDTSTQLITCTRCNGSGETDEDLYPGAGQMPAWLQSFDNPNAPAWQRQVGDLDLPDTDPSLPAV